MSPALEAAAISGIVAVAVALWTAFWTKRMNERLEKAKAASDASLAAFNAKSAEKLKEIEAVASKALADHKHALAKASRVVEEQTEAKAVLDRYRKPLLAAADDLGHRIDNIRLRQFFKAYVAKDNHRRQLALRTTLFRFAKYFGWIELLDRRVTYLDFETEDETQAVSIALRDIGGAFASDSLGRSLMLWREEQRAIGGLMQQPGDGVIGFERFEQLYDDRFSVWFDNFAEDLQREGVENSQRLAQVQERLGTLVFKLDRDGLLSAKSGWLRNTKAYRADGAGGAGTA